jgi:hypothetical protein
VARAAERQALGNIVVAWHRVPDSPQDEVNAFTDQFRKKARFLVDESLGVEVARVLRAQGWNAKYVAEVGLQGHSDEDVFALAWADDRIVLTHDTDFSGRPALSATSKSRGCCAARGAGR